LINNGESIRDFIHIDDVVSIYREILEVKNFPIINVSTGNGQSISSILLFLMKNDININYTNVNLNEIKISMSDNTRLLEIMKGYDFIKVDEYLLSKLKL
jgi:UDP-glucose 4-epimerase